MELHRFYNYVLSIYITEHKTEKSEEKKRKWWKFQTEIFVTALLTDKVFDEHTEKSACLNKVCKTLG